MNRFFSRYDRIAGIVLLGILLSLCVLSIQHKSVTYDEPLHFLNAVNMMHLDATRYSDGVMPFSALNAVPYLIGKWFGHDIEEISDLKNYIILGRYVTMCFSAVLGMVVFSWSKALYGPAAACFSLLLYTFSPNIIAHSRLVTADLYAALMTGVSMYFFWKFLKSRTWRRAIASATALGLAQLTKYTALFLYPIVILILLVLYLRRVLRRPETTGNRLQRVSARSVLTHGLLFLGVGIISVNAGFLFNKTLLPLNAYPFKSEEFQSVQKALKPIARLPVPVPYPYLSGMDWFKYNERHGRYVGNIYFLGKIQRSGSEAMKGFKGYYAIACLFKMPLATLLILGVAIMYYVVNYQAYDFFQDEIHLVFPVVFFFLYFNFFFKVNIGLRHFLPALPLIHIFCGSLFKNFHQFRPAVKTTIGVAAVYLMVSVLSYFPHFISYFNELVLDRKQAFKILADSNIDWGQNTWYIERYMNDHPDAVLNPQGPVNGKVVVEVNKLVGVQGDPETYRRLREQFVPVDHVAYSALVYDTGPGH